MTAIGITGHTRLSKDSQLLIMEALREEIRREPGPAVHGVTCLAAGADQLFAEAVLEAGGTFEVVLPARDYRDAVIAEDNRSDFDRLLAKASSVSYMPFTESQPIAYQAANEELVRRCQRLIAVWDGQPAGGQGGTAEVVSAAQAAGIEVRRIWPDGASRADT
ncbi:hypothetical protein Rhe02_67540 [Rhizocola hellebori]|uniref:DUF1273 family protein n=1 Tax=Rhizocola hellebori TaxID=1392758 RepID=A0A8J3QER8_9ACTN|nr:hypothetical protein [Rhizocola hellebori]GIH08687.1 hypothetical protein Rhe02_67540 [Rhizocola hellebori]